MLITNVEVFDYKQENDPEKLSYKNIDIHEVPFEVIKQLIELNKGLKWGSREIDKNKVFFENYYYKQNYNERGLSVYRNVNDNKFNDLYESLRPDLEFIKSKIGQEVDIKDLPMSDKLSLSKLNYKIKDNVIYVNMYKVESACPRYTMYDSSGVICKVHFKDS